LVDLRQTAGGGLRYNISIAETEDAPVKISSIHVALLTAIGILAFVGAVGTAVPAAAKCMIDEGYGRYTPCEAFYKSKKCMIDEGNGRYTPCEALVRQGKAKKR
jgi:hypothetical protein